MNDVRQIAFVTRRFEELKGLQTALIGAGLLFGSVASAFLGSSNGYRADPFQGAMFANMMVGLSLAVLTPRYRDTFGRIQPSRFDVTSLVTTPLFTLIVGSMLDLIGNGHDQSPSYAALGAALSSAAVLIRDGRWRLHYLIPLTAGLVGAWATAAVAPLAGIASYERDPRRAPVYLFAYTLVGLSVIAAGLLDHLLLARTLRPVDREDSRAAAAERRMRAAALHRRGAAICATVAFVTLCFPSRLMFMIMPLTIAAGLLVLVIGRGSWNAIKLARQFPHGSLPPEALAFDAHTAAGLFAVALAALLDTVRLDAGPALTAMAVAGASLMTAGRDWPLRRHYLLGTAAAIAVLVAMPWLSPATAFTALLFASSAALTLETLLDARRAREVSVTAIGNTDADTI